MGNKKSSSLIVIESNIILKDSRSDSINFELVGFNAHKGKTLNSGHYVTFINEGDRYLVLDDLKPDPLPIPSKRTPEYDPYMLIYKRKI